MSFHCDPCKTTFSSALSQEVHENSPIHKKKIDQLLRLQELNETLHESTTQDDSLETSDDGPQTHDPHIIEVDKNQYFCQLCKAPCSGKIPAFHHIRGQQHTKMLEQANFSPEDAPLSFLAKSTLTPLDSSSIPIDCGMPESGPEIPGFEYNRLTGRHFCKVCQISVTGSTSACAHLRGGKHKKKLRIAGETRHLADGLADMMEGLNLSGSRKTTTSPLDAPKSLIDGSYQQVDGTPVPEYVFPKPTTDDIANAGYLPAVVETVKLIDVPEHGTYGAVLGSEQADNTNGYNGELIQAGTMWACVICDVQLNGDKSIGQHFSGKAHLKKKSLTGGMDAGAGTLPEDIEKHPGSTLLRCNVCNVDLSGVAPMKEHLSGMVHLRNKEINQSYSLPASVLLNPTPVSASTPPRANDAQGNISLWYTPDPSKAAADQNDTRYIDRRSGDAAEARGSGDAAEARGSGIPPPTHPQPFPQDPFALTVDPSLRMSPSIRPPPGSPSTRPPLGFEAVNPSQFRQENPNLLGFTDVDVQSPHGQDLLETEFTLNPRTRRFICNTCRIEVSRAENAVSHLRGANHAKVKALQFQLDHMPPPVTAPPAGVTEPQLPGHTSDRRNFAAASSYPLSPSSRLNDGPESSIEVLRQEGQNHSVSFEISPTRVSTLSALTPTRTNTAQGHTSPWYPPDPSKAAADQNDTRFIDRQSDDAGEACGSGIPPPTNPQTFPQDPLALTVDPSPRMSPSTRPPPGFETVDPSQIRQAVRVGQKDGQSQDLLKTEFQYDRRTQNFICNTCWIEVSGAENAGSHLRGANHAKKVEALHFQLNHMPPPPAISD